jgi:predicted hydrocarbon binding protein
MENELFFPNRLMRITLEALQEVIGAAGMKAIYTLSGLSHLADTLPPDDMERQFAFADFSALFGTLQTMFGPRGAHSLAVRAGRNTFTEGLRIFGKVDAPGVDPGTGPLGPKGVFIRLSRLANFLNSVSSTQASASLTTSENTFHFQIEACPACQGRTSSDPLCSFFEGLLSEAAAAFSGGLEYSVQEKQCRAAGAPACLFEIKLISLLPASATDVQP